MRNIRKIILIFVLSFLFITTIKAENFTCKIDGYEIEYNQNGEIVDVKGFKGKLFSSEFSPTKVSECPDDKDAAITLTDGGISLNVYSISKKQAAQDLGGCNAYTLEGSCRVNDYYACVWNDVVVDGKSYGYCNTDKLLYVKCGDAKDIPYQVPGVISFAVNLLKIATPLILIFVSIISMLKAISAGNEDEMKKTQKGLIRKIIAAVMVFFVISIVQFVIMKVADSEIKSDENGKVETTNLSDCLNCFLNNKCGDSLYYKTYIGSELTETFLSEK